MSTHKMKTNMKKKDQKKNLKLVTTASDKSTHKIENK